MIRPLAGIVLLFLLAHTGKTQPIGKWSGTGEYLPDAPFSNTMKRMDAVKKLVFEIAPGGKVSGKLITEYGVKSLMKQEKGDQQFTITGRYDEEKKLLLLVITHFRSRPDSSESYLTFAKPDSVYYDISTRQAGNTLVVTATANKMYNTNPTAEWVGTFQGGGLGRYPTGNNSMHILPLRVRFNMPQQAAPTHSVANADYKDSSAAAPRPRPVVVNRKPATRLPNVQRTILLDTPFIKLQVYDNGEVDGDTATLIFDGKTILAKQPLSTRPAELTLNVSNPSGEHVLELFANNLGTIPPNTALVVLTCKGKRYEIHLSSDETSNGAVRLRFRE